MVQVIIDGELHQVNGRVARIIRELVHPPLLQRISAPSKGKAIISYGGDDLTIEVTEAFRSRPVDGDRE